MTDLEKVTVQDIILFHEEVARKYDDIERDLLNESILPSIVERPFAESGGQRMYKDVFGQAACLLEGVIRYHPFVDGNKRTALLRAEYFLRVNGHGTFIPDNTPDVLYKVAKHEANAEEEIDALIKTVAEWLETMVAKPPTIPVKHRRRIMHQQVQVGLGEPPRFVKNRDRPGYSVYAMNANSGDRVVVVRRDGKMVGLQLGKRIGSSNRFRIRRLRQRFRL